MSWKLIGEKLLFPPRWLKFILLLISFASLVTVITAGIVINYEYMLYYLAIAYAAIVFVAFCVKEVRKKQKIIKKTLYKNKYTRSYLTDVTLRTRCGLYGALFSNILFVSFNFISAILYKSNWFGLFAIYYGLIGTMRFLILHYMHKIKIGEDPIAELKRSRLCSYILLTINFVLSNVVFMMAVKHNGFKYNGVFIYGIAIATFTIVVIDIIDLIKHRNHECSLVSVTKAIKMTSAMFSVLFLETALLAQLGFNLSQQLQSLIIILTGIVISIVVIFMSLYIIIQTKKEIDKHKYVV